MPDASYQIGPAFWTVAGLKYAATVDPIIVASVKRREPQLTGLAYTARAIYLVVAAGAANYEHIAKLVHCRALMRADPDYIEHRGKRVSMVMLCDDCPAVVADFARRHRVRVSRNRDPNRDTGDSNDCIAERSTSRNPCLA